MPAHNEEEYLPGAVEAAVSGLRALGTDFEIVLVENGSSDDTAALGDSLAVRHPELRCVSLPRGDYGLALRRGFEEATGDIVVNFDVDLVDLDFLKRALDLLDDREVAVVVGSKRTRGAEDRRSPGRRLVTAVFSMILRHGFGLHVSDTHGLKAMRREAMGPVVRQCRYGEDIFDTELLLRAERSGLSVREVPVVVRDVRPPRTSILLRVPKALVGLLRLWIAIRGSRG